MLIKRVEQFLFFEIGKFLIVIRLEHFFKLAKHLKMVNLKFSAV